MRVRNSPFTRCFSFLFLQIYCKIRRTAFAATLRTEVANALVVFGKLEEAAAHYSAAALLLDGSPLPSIAATESALECKVRLLDYAGALDCIGTILDVIKAMRASERGGKSKQPPPVPPPPYAARDGESVSPAESPGPAALPSDEFWVLGTGLRHTAYGSIVCRNEITAVLLMLQLPRAVRDGHRFSAVLERYRGVDDGRRPCYMPEEVYLQIQTVLQAAEDEDIATLHGVQSELWFPLTAIQNELLFSLQQLQ